MVGFKPKNFIPGRTNYTNKQVKRIMATLQRLNNLEKGLATLKKINQQRRSKLSALRKKTPKK